MAVTARPIARSAGRRRAAACAVHAPGRVEMVILEVMVFACHACRMDLDGYLYIIVHVDRRIFPVDRAGTSLRAIFAHQFYLSIYLDLLQRTFCWYIFECT